MFYKVQIVNLNLFVVHDEIFMDQLFMKEKARGEKRELK